MYRKTRHKEEFPEIALHFEGRLDPENRWVKMAARLPWEELESDYAKHFKSHGRGEIALNVRIAIGALLIKEVLGLSINGASINGASLYILFVIKWGQNIGYLEWVISWLIAKPL